MALIRQC